MPYSYILLKNCKIARYNNGTFAKHPAYGIVQIQGTWWGTAGLLSSPWKVACTVGDESILTKSLLFFIHQNDQTRGYLLDALERGSEILHDYAFMLQVVDVITNIERSEVQ